MAIESLKKLAFESFSWANRRVPEGIRKEIAKIDPNGRSPLTRHEFNTLDGVQKDRVHDVVTALRLLNQFPSVTRRHDVGRAGHLVSSFDLHGKDDRRFTDINTAVSRDNVVTPLFPTSVVKKGRLNYDEQLLATLRSAQRFVFIQGYELDRADIVDILIGKAKAGVPVYAVFHPAQDGESAKKTLLQRMRDAKLPNLHVVESALLPADKRGISQIMHVKKVFAGTPDGGVVEVSGGINFNENSVKNFDFGWRTEGVAVLDSLQHAVDHLHASAPQVQFDGSLLPSVEKLRKIVAARAAEVKLPLVTVEMAAAGTRNVEQPRDYPLQKLRERAKLGRKIIISSVEALKPEKEALLKLAVQNGAPVTVVQVPMTDPETDAFEKLRPKLKGLGIAVHKHNALVVDHSYAKLVCRELDAAIANEESIVVGAFALSHAEVLDRLVRAKQAGCAVRVLVDDLTINNTMVNRKAIAVLTGGGVEVRAIDEKVKKQLAPKAGTAAELLKLHGKFIVLGGDRVLAGSANPTASGMELNIEDGRLVRSKMVAAALTKTLFDPLWQKASSVRPMARVNDASRVPLLPSVPLDTKVEDLVFMVFDFETTGFVPGHDERIIQLAAQAVRVKKDGTLQELDKLNAYITPGTDPLGRPLQIPQNITALTGIDAARIQANGDKRLRDVLPEFVAMVQRMQKHGPVVLVGQNVPFDLRFLDHALSRAELGVKTAEGVKHFTFDSTYVDTVDVSLRLAPQEPQHNLDKQMQRLGIPQDPTLPRHDAFSDVVLTGRVLAKSIATGKLSKLEDLLGEDMLQFRDGVQTQLLSPSGSVSTHVLEFDDKKKLVLRGRDAATGALGNPERVRMVTVKGMKNGLIEVGVVLGTQASPREILGTVEASKVDFRNPGPVFHKLREAGVRLAKPDVIRT